jgi:hypothetical protein
MRGESNSELTQPTKHTLSLVAGTGELDPAGVHMSENPPCPSGVGLPESSSELALDSA